MQASHGVAITAVELWNGHLGYFRRPLLDKVVRVTVNFVSGAGGRGFVLSLNFLSFSFLPFSGIQK